MRHLIATLAIGALLVFGSLFSPLIVIDPAYADDVEVIVVIGQRPNSGFNGGVFIDHYMVDWNPVFLPQYQVIGQETSFNCQVFDLNPVMELPITELHIRNSYPNTSGGYEAPGGRTLIVTRPGPEAGATNGIVWRETSPGSDSFMGYPRTNFLQKCEPDN